MTREDEALRALPRHAPPPGPPAEARAAFLQGASHETWSARLTRIAVPAVLASVVGLYLSWAFAAAIALNQ